MNKCIKYLGILIILMAFAAVGVMTASAQPTAGDGTPIESDVAVDAEITVTFSEEMNTSSAEAAFYVDQSFTVNSFSWDTNNMTMTVAHDGLAAGTTYTLTIGTGAKDRAGIHMEASYSWNFTTLPAEDTTAPNVTANTPIGNTVAVSTSINVTFSEAMDETAAQVAFDIDPYVKGTFNWTVDTMIFTPNSDLEHSKTYNVTIETGAKGLAGTPMAAPFSWEFTTVSQEYFTGNRIWDEDTCGDPYRWTAQTFTGFYYDIDDGLSTETLTIKGIDRSLSKESIVYETTVRNVTFDRSRWGTYNVIGFMAEKYFAGYIKGEVDKDITEDTISLVSNKMLSKVLIDEDDKHMVSTGASLELKEGYEIRIIQLDLQGDKAQIELLRDGKHVDDGIIATTPATYVYTRDIGSVDDVPIVAVYVDSVFAGTESDMIVIKGIFQISEDYKSIKTGDEYGEMEITRTASTGITMENEDTVSLDEGEIVDLMGDIKFLVADDSSTLRFALYKEITTPGTYDIRGTVYDTTEKPTWTPMNFEGFYYDIDEDLGTERLEIEEKGTSIDDGNLVYTTTVQSVEFDYSGWKKYNVIGFMAEKYFAGYNDDTHDDITDDTISLVSNKMLSKVLIDSDKKHTVSTGASLELEEGYEVKIIQLDVSGDKAQIELIKNGKSVDTGIIDNTPVTYTYTQNIGKADDVPVVVIRVDSVFAGTESDMLVIKGIFQISENYKSVENDDKYGEMEVKTTSSTKITMKNEDSISLNEGGNTMIMGDIGIMTSDDGGRYALFVRRTVGSIAKLEIELPESLIVDEEIVITITADGSPVEGAEVQFAGENMGLTDSNGEVRITPEDAGTFTITAIKENYDSASAEMRILTEEEASMDPLEIEMPDKVEPGEDVVIKVTYKGDAIEGASITWDGNYIDDTDETGSLTYTAEAEGTYTVTANKDGYLEGSEKIEVAAPSAEFDLAELTVPEEVSANKKFTVSVEVTNTGDDSGTYLAELEVNGTVVDSQNVTLDAGDTEKIEFTTEIAEAGTATIEIGTESGEITVTKTKSNIALIAAVLLLLLLLGAIGYLLISSAPEGGWTVAKLGDAIKNLFRGGKGL